MFAKLNRFEVELVRKGQHQAAFDSMFSRFNRSVQEYGLLKDLKERKFYVKPSTRRSKKKLNKIVKSRRESALHQKRVQGHTEQGYK